MRVTGKVKFFREPEGFGFICPDDASEDVFVHRTDLSPAFRSQGEPRRTLRPDQCVSYETAEGSQGKGYKAVNVEPA
jgi:CspA family cold shock protein